MQIIKVNQGDLKALKQFVDSCGSSLTTFRYFKSRPYEVIEKHLITLMVYIDCKAVAYGHLDVENDTVWLGICVSEEHLGKGYGKSMMQALLDIGHTEGIREIRLSVDVENEKASGLYEKFGFKLSHSSEAVHYYSLSLFSE